LRWSPTTVAEAESSQLASPGSASSAPASPATPCPPAMAALQSQQPGDSSPDPSLPSTPKANPAANSASLQYSTHQHVTDSLQASSNRRAHSQPLHDRSPGALCSNEAEGIPDEPRTQASVHRPASAQDQRSVPLLPEPQTAQKGRPRSLTFPLPHQRHLEPSRLSPQTPLSSAPGSHVKVSIP